MESEKQVLKKLGIKDFRNITKDQVIELVSSISELPKEVATKALEQVPYFMDTAKSVVDNYYNLCISLINDNHDLIITEIKAYQDILDICKIRIEMFSDIIPHNEYIDIINQMRIVADKIKETVKRHESFKNRIAGFAGQLGALALGIGGAILGVKLKK